MSLPLPSIDTRSALKAPTQRAAQLDHFSTNHLLAGIKGRSIRGGATTLTAQGLKFVLQIGSTMVLARLLTPGDFGLIAMVTAITGFVAMFKDAGLSMATIQRKDITHDQVSTLLWINVALSAVVMLIVVALAPLIAAFYAEPRLVWITLALAGTMVFGGFTVQHQALLRRQMRFVALAAVDVISMTAGIVVAIIMALWDFGYWALVANFAAAGFANAIMVWSLCTWRPGSPKRHCGVGSMLRFGGGLTGFNVLNYFTRNADNVIVGMLLGSAPLGIYSKAYGLLMLPIRQINAPVSSVMLPALSRLQDTPARYRRAFLLAVSALAMAGMPIVICAFVVANEAVAILLGPGWEAAASVFRWLAPAAFFGTINVAPGWLCVSLRRADVQIRWSLLSAPLTVASFFIGIRWGIQGIAAAFSASWCLGLFIFLVMACRGSPVSVSDIARSLAAPATASCTSLAVGLAMQLLLADSYSAPALRCAVLLPLVAVSYLLSLCLFPAGRTQLRMLVRDGLRSVTSPGRETS